MGKRLSILLLLLAAVGLAAGSPPVRAQDNSALPPSEDTPLPELLDDTDELPPAEELPAADDAGTDANADAATPSTEELNLPLDDTVSGADSTGDDEPIVNEEGSAAEELVPQETIQERYENGRVKIERGVAQDERENYVNHGPWKMWDEQGNLIAEGTYREGQREGKWTRWYRPDEAELFGTAPFNLFSGPFQSQATFREGQLDGEWVITDQANLRICSWSFVRGHRHGESVWYYHTGRKLRAIHYRDGELHGELLEWDMNGQLARRVQYEEGRRHEPTVENYPDGQKKTEGMVLQARLVMKHADDWWEARIATYNAQGKDEKHGAWSAWYPNGVQRFAGEYQYDKPSGEFTWWHPNGQKSLSANYEQGVKQGPWTWWHPNGQKSIQGRYLDDSPTGPWIWWHDTGKVAQRVDFSQAGTSVVEGEPNLSDRALLRETSN